MPEQLELQEMLELEQLRADQVQLEHQEQIIMFGSLLKIMYR